MNKSKVRSLFHSCSCLSAALLLVCVWGAAIAQSPQPITPAIEQKVDAMIHKLTLEQKIRLIGGGTGMATQSEPSIGLPELRMSDGPVGVRSWGPSTAYAAGIGLAASWDTELAKKVGVGLGEDARARGVNFLLGPAVDIYRLPLNGRNFEYFGEDPYLAGQIAVGYVDGVQSQGVSATIKHFAANNSEYDRREVNSVVDERTLREIYLPTFEAAVKQAHVGAVMDSYNLLNGEHATQNKFLNIQVLRKDWNFRGIVMSDWEATHDGIAAANGGLDLEMPSPQYMNAATLIPAIKDGKVSVATIDEKVRHILQTAMRFGFFDGNQTDRSIPLFNQHGDQIALESAEEGAVLLKNQGHLLPLDRHAIHSIAVLGPDAYPAQPSGGGSAHTDPFVPVSFMTGLSDSLYPGIKVYWNAGIKTPEDIFSGTSWCTTPSCKIKGILRTEYLEKTGAEVASVTDSRVSSFDAQGDGISSGFKRVEWVGYYMPKATGEYRVVAAANPGEHFKLLVNNRQVLEIPGRTNLRGPKAIPIKMVAGKPAKIQLIYWPLTTHKIAGLGVIAENRLLDPEAMKLAKMADVAVVSVGFSPRTEGEGRDRSYKLPFGQQKLIRAIAAANPHTIVVLTAGGSIATQDWLSHVPAFLQTWYGGAQAGNALTKILFGDVNPSGKLPMSWEKKLTDNPTYKNYYEKSGTKDSVYTEGIFLGYRYYDKSTVKPLYPFGFGLSYTRFAFSNLTVTPETASPDAPITVGFDVKNIGARAGAEVAQLYVGDPSATVPRPVKELKGFSRVSLDPGESQHVTMKLNRRSLAYWNTAMHNWKVDPGKFIVYVGDSSENVPLQQSFTVQ